MLRTIPGSYAASAGCAAPRPRCAWRYAHLCARGWVYRGVRSWGWVWVCVQGCARCAWVRAGVDGREFKKHLGGHLAALPSAPTSTPHPDTHSRPSNFQPQANPRKPPADTPRIHRPSRAASPPPLPAQPRYLPAAPGAGRYRPAALPSAGAALHLRAHSAVAAAPRGRM